MEFPAVAIWQARLPVQQKIIADRLAGEPFILLADEPTGNLDSKTLGDLHREGATISLVTHDKHYAEFAERTIHLLDGRVVVQDEGSFVKLS